MSEWKVYKLGDIVNFTSGGTPSKSNEAFWGGNIPWISASSMEGYTYSDSTLKITELGLKNGSRIAPKNSILLLVRGSILHQKLQVGIVERDVAFNQDVKCLQADEEIIDPWFLLLWFKSEEKNLLNKVESTGIGAGKLDTAILKDLLIKVPPINERRKLNDFFKAIQGKIELNRQMNQTLEAMAQAMFKSWFVDFDPVLDNTLAQGNDIPEELQARAEKRRVIASGAKQSNQALKPLVHTNPALAAQFPASFVFNETLGKWIPEGWEVKTVEEAINVNPSVSIKKGEVRKYVDMKALPTSGYSIDGFTFKEYSGGAKFIEGDVLIARITPCLENGKTAIVDFLNENEKGFGSTEFIVLRGKGDIKTPFVACLSRYEGFVNHCIQNMVGSSGRQRVQNSCFNSYYLVLPDSEILSKFHLETDPIFKKITSNSDELQTLTQLRDRLLPELISGRVRVKEVINK